MPLARIDLAEGKSADYRKAIGEVVYQAMVETLKAPKDDRFQIITERAKLTNVCCKRRVRLNAACIQVPSDSLASAAPATVS